MSQHWREMTPDHRDRAIAALVGWTGADEETYSPGTAWVWRDRTGHKIHNIHKPTLDPNFARQAEDEVDRRDKQYWYLLHLYRIMCNAPDMESIRFLHFNEIWFMFRATPEQRCEAAYMVLEPA